VPSHNLTGLPPNREDPHRHLLVTAATAELLALTSGSPATVLAAGLLAWVLRYWLDITGR
jgi:hypothetical protein